MRLLPKWPSPQVLRYLCSGTFNTLGGYASFILVAHYLPQWLAAILTDSVFQVIRYHLFRHWVFARGSQKFGHFPGYIKRSLPISLVGYANITVLSLWFPAWLTGLVNVGMAVLAYLIFRRFFRAPVDERLRGTAAEAAERL